MRWLLYISIIASINSKDCHGPGNGHVQNDINSHRASPILQMVMLTINVYTGQHSIVLSLLQPKDTSTTEKDPIPNGTP